MIRQSISGNCASTSEAGKPAIYEAGTLRYTLPKLIFVCIWILLSIMVVDLLSYKVMTTIMPVFLDNRQVSSKSIALVSARSLRR